MRSKTFLILLVICVILAGLSFFSFRQKKSHETKSFLGAQLFTDLEINEITRIIILSPQAEVNLKKSDPFWAVAERFNQPADFDQLIDLVKQIADLKVGRRFEASAEAIDRLGLQDPKDKSLPEKVRGIKIIFKNSQNKILADILLGKIRESSGSSGGQYIRLADQNQVILVDNSFRFINKKPEEWLQKELVTVNAAQIEKMECFEPGNNSQPLYTLIRPEQDKDPVLLNPPKGKKPDQNKPDQNKIDQTFEALDPLRIDDIKGPADKEKTDFSEHYSFVYSLYNGIKYTVYSSDKPLADKDKYYLNISLSFTAPTLKQDKNETKQPLKTEKFQEEPAQKTKKLNNQISPWTYVISTWQHESFVKDIKKFIKIESKTLSK